MGFNCFNATRRQFTFYHLVHKSSSYSFDQPRKDETILAPPSGFDPVP